MHVFSQRLLCVFSFSLCWTTTVDMLQHDSAVALFSDLIKKNKKRSGSKGQEMPYQFLVFI